MIWSLLQNMGGRGLSFLVTIILARLLTPAYFGLIGMLSIFITISQALVFSGFNEALIQKKDIDEGDYSSVFWLNLVVSMMLYCVLFFSAPFISSFYDQTALTDITRVYAIVFVVNAFSYVQETRLRREMRFRTLTVMQLPSAIVGGIVSILMAFMGMGVWSIVALELVTRFVFAVQISLYSHWRPLFIFEFSKVKRLFDFGWKLMASSLLNAIYQNIYTVVIGKFFSLNSVGYYQTAYKVVKTPSSTLSNSLGTVVFSAFSSIQDDDVRLKIAYKGIITQVLFWICPAFLFTAILADPLFDMVFGTQWMPAVPYFRMLCIVGVFYPLNAYNLTIVKVKGRSDLFLKLELIKKLVVSIGVVISVPLGVFFLVGFQAVSAIISYYINSYFSGRFIQYPMKEQIRDILPIAVLSCCAGAAIFLIDRILIGSSDWVRLLVGFGIGIGIYWFMSRAIRISAYFDFLNITRNKLSFK